MSCYCLKCIVKFLPENVLVLVIVYSCVSISFSHFQFSMFLMARCIFTLFSLYYGFWVVLMFNWRNKLDYVLEVYINSMSDNIPVEVAL